MAAGGRTREGARFAATLIILYRGVSVDRIHRAATLRESDCSDVTIEAATFSHLIHILILRNLLVVNAILHDDDRSCCSSSHWQWKHQTASATTALTIGHVKSGKLVAGSIARLRFCLWICESVCPMWQSLQTSSRVRRGAPAPGRARFASTRGR